MQLGFLVFIGFLHHLERLARGAQNGAAQGQDVGKLFGLHRVVIALDQTAIAVADAVERHVLAEFIIKRLGYTAQGRVQALAVAAAG